MPEENHPRGFLEIPRLPIGKRDPVERVRDFRQIYAFEWDENQLKQQGQRCMDCGVPTCMGGCPIGNIIPDWNDLVYRGQWLEALDRLHVTNNFPEFTGYTCPAPCEPACVLAYNDDPVTIKDIERAIVDRGWREGWIVPEPPARRSDKKVAVVGSGPAGLSCAQQLNRVGHSVTVFERDDAVGGLMTYGIPDFKFEKYQVQRRVSQLSAEGVQFKTGLNVGKDVTLEQLRKQFDAVCLAIGALKHRDIEIPGRELSGIHFGMDFLTAENRRQAKRSFIPIEAGGRNVIVLGGGDTGADCVATAHRQGAASVTQLSINPKPPDERPANRPWPLEPGTYECTYAQAEGGVERFMLNSAQFVDEDNDGRVDAIVVERVQWDRDAAGLRTDKHVLEAGIRIPADLVLIAIGFRGPEYEFFAETGLAFTKRHTLDTDARLMTALPGVFACGDARRGQSIVVWAIGEGREAARHIDAWMMGSSRLPPSLQTATPPTEEF